MFKSFKILHTFVKILLKNHQVTLYIHENPQITYKVFLKTRYIHIYIHIRTRTHIYTYIQVNY